MSADQLTVNELIHQMNWKLLKAQKTILLNMTGKKNLTEAEQCTLTGMINLVDAIQDAAIDRYGYDRLEVLNLSVAGSDDPNMSLEEAKYIVLNEGKKPEPKADIVLYTDEEMRAAANKVLDNWDKKSYRNKLKKKYFDMFEHQWEAYERIFRQEDKRRQEETENA